MPIHLEVRPEAFPTGLAMPVRTSFYAISGLTLSKKGLQGIFFGFFDMLSHDSFAKFRVAQSQGQHNFSMSLDRPLPSVGILKGIFPVSQHVFSHVHDEMVKPVLIRDQFKKRIMELGVPLKYLVNPVFPQGLFRLFNQPVELIERFLGNVFRDKLKRISLQDGPKFEKFFDFFLRIPGSDKTSLLTRCDETL